MPSSRTRTTAARIGRTATLAGLAAVLYEAGRSRPLPPTELTADPPALPPGRVVAVPGHGELFFRELDGPAGGPTFLLLHGWMFPSDVTWFPAYRPLSTLGRVLALDHRGHGRGPRPPEPFRLEDAADDAAALVRHLGAGPVVAIGYSMGGVIAQLLARRHPDAVEGLVLCATSATFSATPWERWRWRAMGALQVGLRLLPRATWERAVLAQADGRLPVRITRLVHEDTPEQILDLLPWVVGELHRGSVEDVAEAGREMGRYDARGWLGSLDVPTTVLVTARDQLVPPVRQWELAAAIPGARAVELPLDHDACVGGSERFVPALLDAARGVHDAARGGHDAAGAARAGGALPAQGLWRGA